MSRILSGRLLHAALLSAATVVAGVILPTAAVRADAVSVNGAGSTFAYPMYSKWFDAYRSVDSNLQMNYESIGSGAGIKKLISGVVDFGGTDGPMNADQLKQFSASHNGAHVLHFPTALGAVCATYNIPGVTEALNFTPEALAGIFLGKITKWNDAAIAASNSGVKLPDQDIVVVHRAEGSGTTYVWADYLAKVSPEWKKDMGVATALKWPTSTIGAKGNEGVAGQIKNTAGAIGYVELIYALQNKLTVGKVKNASGKFVEANLASTSAAAAGASKDMPEDFRVSITNAEGDDAYPISTFTWLLIPDHIEDQAKHDAIVKFLNWSLDQGQQLLEPLAYAKLPTAVVEMEKKAIDKVK